MPFPFLSTASGEVLDIFLPHLEGPSGSDAAFLRLLVDRNGFSTRKLIGNTKH